MKRNNRALFITVLMLQFAFLSAFSQSFDLEYITLEKTENQDPTSEYINVIANLEKARLSSISKIHIIADNTSKEDRAGNSIGQITIEVEPDKAFVVSDMRTKITIDRYLNRLVTFSETEEQLRRDPTVLVAKLHPTIFHYPETNTVKILLPGYPSNSSSYAFQVELEFDSGRRLALPPGKTERVLN